MIWLFTLPPFIASAEEIVVTEQQVLALFYQRNLNMIAAKYGLAQAQAQQIIAAAVPNPVFSQEVNQITGHYPVPNTGPAIHTRLDQLIETAGKRRLRIESSQLGTEAAENDLKDTIRVFSNTVRHAFYGLLLSQKSVAIVREAVSGYEEILQANALRLKAGDIAQWEFARIEVEVLDSQSDLDKALAALTRARSELAVLLAWPENAKQFIAENRWPEIKQFNYPLKEEALLRQATFQRPDIHAAQLRIGQAHKNLELAHRLRIPDITVGIGYAHDYGDVVVDTAMIGISVPLPLFYQYQGEIGKSAVKLNSAKLQIRQIEQNLKTEITSAVAAWNAATSMVKRYQEGVLERIAKIQDSAEFAYNHGNIDLTDLIQARRDYKARMLKYYATLADRSFAYADLASALGEVNLQ